MYACDLCDRKVEYDRCVLNHLHFVTGNRGITDGEDAAAISPIYFILRAPCVVVVILW